MMSKADEKKIRLKMKSEKRQTEEKKKKTDLTKTKEEINKFEKPEIIVPTISFLHIFFFS